MTFSSRLGADAAAGPRERALGELRRQRRSRRVGGGARVRQHDVEQLGRVDPPEVERPAVHVEEDHVRLAARAEALGESQAYASLQAGRIVLAPQRGPREAGRAVIGVTAAAAETREHQPGISHARPWYSSFEPAPGGEAR